ncbi:lithostathine-2-like precursor [Mesocricetus auratus]|uniref:Lithostathine-2-like precursor n=1 Tax=Mesocricetus auratus TaxID=10036 RepID=A2ID67_MESAU|nr:lithostathine-2-like precursor [Mesocricetus auratus]ABM63318.1 regenerating protein 2 [Mesocricetus auratus]
MAQTNIYYVLFPCLMLLSCSQGQKAEESMPMDEKDLPSARINCPEGANAYGSYCYYFIEDCMAWGEADLFCQNMNSGHLVSVLSQAEGTFVASLVKESGITVSNVWIGLHDPKNNRRWHWSSGSLFLYKSWATGAPSTSNRGFCVSLTSNTAYKKWKDENCDALYSFVCKFKS